MNVLTIICVHLLMLLPVYGEVIFDNLVWKFKWFGGEDKPFSTWVVRPILFITGCLLAWWIGDKELWRVGFVMITAFLAWFNPIIGLCLVGKICHLGDNWFDKLIGRIHCLFRIWLFIWLYIVALCTYYYYELYYNLF